jgi:hypothetical protein
MDKNTFFQYQENHAQAGYRSAVLYKETGESKYKFLCASETVPFPFGTKETFEFNLLNSSVVGQVEGKDTIEQKEIELLYTRNNAILFEKLKGRVLDFMSLTPQMVGYKYTGTIAFRPNDATNDIHRGTYTITPMDADATPYYTARDEVLIPMFFANSIPDEISAASVTGTDIAINVSLKNAPTGTVSYTYKTIVKGSNGVEAEGTATSLTASNGIVSIPKTAGLYVIYAEPPTSTTPTHSGCFTSVYVTA